MMRTALVITLTTLLSPAARALVPMEGAAAPECPAIRGVLIHEDGRERLILQARYTGDGAAFAWLIPVPAQMPAEGARLVDSSALGEIDEYTAPRIIRYIEQEQPGCVCANLDAIMPTGDTEIIADPPLWESTTDDGYGVRVLSDAESADVEGTLAALHYEPVGLTSYATDGWRFVLMEVSPDEAFAGASRQGTGGGYDVALHAIELSFDSPTAVLPLRALVSGTAACNVTLLCVTPSRSRTSGHTTVDMDTAGLEDADDPAAAYTERLASLIDAQSDPAWVTEYAETLRYDLADALSLSQSRVRWLTRLRSSASAGNAARDLQLISSSSDDRLTIVLYVPIVRRAHAALPSVLAGGIAAALVRRGRRSRCAALAALLVALACA